MNEDLVKNMDEFGYVTYRLNGKLHRTDGPAVERFDGYKSWHLNGKRHRIDGPAIIYPNGDKEWWKEDIQYTENFENKLNKIKMDKEFEKNVRENRYTTYRLNGRLHREDGPAVEWTNGDKHWWVDGLRHREDGPAIEYSDGTKEYWLEGIEYTEEEFNNKIKE
jgi:hypothetical protein